MTILPAHTQRIVFHKAMASAHLIAAEFDCAATDVIDIVVGGLLTTETRIPVSAPSQPGETSRSHATAAETDGAAEPPVPTEPSVDLTGLAAHEQGPSPELPSPGNAPEPESRSTRSRPSGSGDFLQDGEVAADAPRRTNRQRVMECHQAHPDWTAQDVADELGLSKANVWTIGSQLKIKWPSKKASTTEALKRATERAQGGETPSEPHEQAPEPEQPPANKPDDLKERLIALHAAEAGLTRPELAQRLGESKGKINYWVEKLGLDVPHVRRTDDEPFTPEIIPPANPQKPVAPPPPSTGTLTDRVRALHHQHPNWTGRMIANELGANVGSVSVALSKIRNASAPPAPASKPQFTGRRDMINHYSEVAKRLGKAS